MEQEIIKSKICSKCKRELPLSMNYFEKRKEAADGFRGVCRECRGRSFKNGCKSENINLFKKCKCCRKIKELNIKNFKVSKTNSDGYKNTCIECQLKNRGKSINANMKKCIRCKRDLPLDEEFFRVDELCLDGYRNICRECGGEHFGERRKFNYWSEEEDKILLESYAQISNKDLVELIPKHTVQSIKDRAIKVLGLCKDQNYLNQRAWTYEEDEYIKTFYPSIDNNALSQILGKDMTIIVARAMKLGVKKDSFWSDEEMNYLFNNYGNISTIELQQVYLTNRTIIAINNQARKYNLRKSPDYLNELNKSNGEHIISEILSKYCVDFEREVSIRKIDPDCPKSLRFDFYIPSVDIFIEYQGIQHYEAVDFFGGEEQFYIQIYNDKYKIQCCDKYNKKILIIPYWDFNNIENILKDQLNLDTLKYKK